MTAAHPEPGVWVIDLSTTPLDEDSIRDALRTLVQTTRERGAGRSWAVVGEVHTGADATEPAETDRHALAHDRVGRHAVRLAVDTVIAVGTGRTARALHQGTVMEGSWGDEARLVEDASAAADLLCAEATETDVVLVAGGRTDLSAVVARLLDDVRCAATRVAP